ncbi:MAG TPA: hypothetical protein VFS58_11755 [Steroidobacteraceae bacterium]|nr:hypothetical protein [Steroidobacteraceae bacterium]
MLYLLNAQSPARYRPQAAERRRAVIIGAGVTGIAAAFHLGEHCLLLERREKLEDADDHPHTLPMGTARRGTLVDEIPGAEPQRAGTSAAERKALFISCSSTSEATPASHTLIHLARWQPPELSPKPVDDEHSVPPSLQILAASLRGELRLGMQVGRVSPSRHLLELEDGSCIVYDRLLSTISLSVLAGMCMHELPERVRSNEILRCWLSEQDIEVGDPASRAGRGDIDGFAAGKRIADQMNAALTVRFGTIGRTTSRGPGLFAPRLVETSVSRMP